VIVATRKGSIVALDGRTGEVRRRAKTSAGVWSSPALDNSGLVIASSDGFLEGRHAGTLVRRWRKRLPAGSLSGLTVDDGVVYLCSGRTLLGFRIVDGVEVLRVALRATSFTSPAVDAASPTLVVGDRGGNVYAVDRRSGVIRWRSVTRRGAHNDGSPTIAGDRVLIGSDAGALYAFSLAGGAPLWQAAATGWVVSTPAVHDGVVYFGSDDDVLRAVDARDGGLRWQRRLGGDIASSPTVIGGMLIHGAHDGKLHIHTLDGARPHPSIDAGAPLYASIAVGSTGWFVAATHRGRVIAVE
jgi:outer membrane protein assembly factor BamB